MMTVEMVFSCSATGAGDDDMIVGEIRSFGMATLPAQWLACDGAAVSRTTYTLLFAQVGVVWGTGDGSTTFNVPDLRSRSPMGSGTGSGLSARTLGQHVGEELHVLDVAELATHTHTLTDPGHTHSVPVSTAGGAGGAASIQGGADDPDSPVVNQPDDAETGISAANAGSNTGHNTVHPSSVVTYGIFAGA